MSGAVLSPRRVRALVSPGQRWIDSDGQAWTVRQVHRKDGMVRLEPPRSSGPPALRACFPSFACLGRNYRLEDGLGGER